VWVNQEEISALAEIVGVQDADEFERLYVRNIGMRKSLREYSNGDCVFFDGQTRRCNVYEARPRQCRTWPFWNSNVRTPQSWARTCEVCPGSGTGRLYSLEEIETTRQVIRI
jgi:Fe-S-cluster containining protein